MWRALTIAIVGYHFDLKHDLQMLKSINLQGVEDITVLFLDPYKSTAREKIIREWGHYTGISAIYWPYSLPPMPRTYDWAAWNQPFLISESSVIFRYQQFRLLSRDFLRTYFEHFFGQNVALSRNHVTGINESSIHYDSHNGMANKVHPFDGTTVLSGHQNEITHTNSIGGAYGDWVLRIDDFLNINGIDEVSTTLRHYEDVDMECRWRVAASLEKVGMVAVFPDYCYRMDDTVRWPDAQERMNRRRNEIAGCNKKPVLRPPPTKVEKTSISGWVSNCKQCWDDFGLLRDGGEGHLQAIPVGRINSQDWYRCSCGGIFHKQTNPEFVTMGQEMLIEGTYRATIGIDRFGRDLQALREKCMAMKSVEDRINFCNQWAQMI